MEYWSIDEQLILLLSITPVGPISIVEFYEIDELRFQL